MDAADDSDRMDDAPATPPLNVSDDDIASDMATDDEENLLAYTGLGQDGSSSDGFEHI